jgi:hypothetical protein
MGYMMSGGELDTGGKRKRCQILYGNIKKEVGNIREEFSNMGH